MTIQEYVTSFVDSTFEGNFPFLVTEKTVEKDEIISAYSVIENKVYYLQSGIVQVTIQRNGENRILDFFFPSGFFCSYSSLISCTPSDVQITAMTHCVLNVIKYSDLAKAYDHSLIANKIGRVETEKLYLKKVKREKDFLTKTAEEMYLELVRHHPEMIREIPVNKIARYLGIYPESLSRIRRQSIS